MTIENLVNAGTEQKDKTLDLLRKLSFADGKYGKDEVGFILKIQKDLGFQAIGKA
ncbi:MAG: hypothetical protein HC836_39335 [Richelia sp. RM2_1_2]|nr:hypothetical protein [Richelia sp. RM2_1_2]